MPDYCLITDVDSWMPVGQSLQSQTGEPSRATVSSWITIYSNALGTLGADDANMAKLLLPRELVFQVMAKRSAMRNDKVQPEYETWHEEWKAWAAKFGFIPPDTGGSTTPVLSAPIKLAVPDQDPAFTRDKIF